MNIFYSTLWSNIKTRAKCTSFEHIMVELYVECYMNVLFFCFSFYTKISALASKISSIISKFRCFVKQDYYSKTVVLFLKMVSVFSDGLMTMNNCAIFVEMNVFCGWLQSSPNIESKIRCLNSFQYLIHVAPKPKNNIRTLKYFLQQSKF